MTKMTKTTLLKKIGALQATSFQKSVWRILLTIPAGEVRSYAWVARKIGRPGAVRAVGSAVGKNPLAPDVPCHRVIRSDGSLGGYSGRGGVRTKRALLKKESGRPVRRRRS
jgi:methylated-DNA-[protein]-cysteine S-methyltransferase